MFSREELHPDSLIDLLTKSGQGSNFVIPLPDNSHIEEYTENERRADVQHQRNGHQ